MCPEGSSAFERHVILRDYLRHHPDKAREYGAVKKRLAEQYHHDRTKYQAAKCEFVDSLMEEARQELKRDQNERRDSVS